MTDVSDTLTELEQKLKDLERELARAHEDPHVPAPAASPVALDMPAPSIAPAGASLADDTRARIGALHGQLDELDRFRDRLHASAAGLMAEYQRLLDAVHATEPAAAPTSGLAAAPAPPAPVAAPSPASPLAMRPAATAPHPAPVAALAEEPAARPSPVVIAAARPAAVARPAALATDPDARVLHGDIHIDAGPFTDIGALARFETALESLDGIRDVYVRGFEEDRAHIDVSLTVPLAFASALHEAAGDGVRVATVIGQHVTITVDE